MEDNESQPVEIEKSRDIFLGQIVHSKNEAYDLYQEHGFKMGFSVRKGKELYYDNDKKNTRLKDFYCSKQGFKNNEPECEIASKVAYQRADSRTNCKAMVRFNVSKDGEWRITKLIMDHNHEFVPLEQRHLLRSMRKVSEAKGGVIKSMVNAGMKVTNIWNYLGEEVGGYDKLGMTMKDMHNFVYNEKMKLIEAEDAQSLVNHLQNRQAQDPMFYYSVQLDQESRLTNVFWRDDQDGAMAKAIGEVMPNTSHRLCLWHISKNAPSHLGDLKSDQKFQSLFNKCMSGCDSKEEFESTWSDMINEYKLQNHSWLSGMYKIRHKWSTAYSKDVFSADIKSSQRSESTNSVLGEISGKTTSLSQFLLVFEKMVNKWRQLETEKEFKNSQSMPPRIINISETLRQASIGGSDNLSYHEVSSNHKSNKKHIVAFDSSATTISCSCRKFDSMGILCSHALRIYNIKGILRIPDQYFLRRWSKKARSVVYDHIHESGKEDSLSKNAMTNGGNSIILYRNAIMKFFYNLVLDSQEHKETQQIMWKLLYNGAESVHQCISELNLNLKATTSENNFNQNEDTEHVAISNPLPAKTKGMSNTRKKGHFEKRKGSTTKEKQHKKKKREDNFCSINSSMDGPSIVQHNIDNTLNVPFTSLGAPLEDYHSSSLGGAPPIPFASMLQGTDSCNSLIQECSDYRFTPSSAFQDRQAHKRN
ncbi:protein FAR1-RELATED SEQUENCE [Trifolium repens]|nr:protein FAR1-RELATED SEQUENCE [Trifolium repens]